MLVKSMLHEDKQDSGTGRGRSILGGTAAQFFFLHISGVQTDKESHYIMQFGPPNPLEKCMIQVLKTKIAIKRCHIELFDKKLMKYTTFGNYNLIYYIKIVSCNKRYPCTV